MLSNPPLSVRNVLIRVKPLWELTYGIKRCFLSCMINHSKAIFSLLAPMFPNWSISLFDLFSPLPCAESVRDAVGRKVKLSLRKRVKLEIKGDKTENRVLVSQFLLPLSRYFFIRSNAVAVCLYISHLKFSVLMKEHQNPPCFIPSSALEWPALFPGEHHFSAL